MSNETAPETTTEPVKDETNVETAPAPTTTATETVTAPEAPAPTTDATNEMAKDTTKNKTKTAVSTAKANNTIPTNPPTTAVASTDTPTKAKETKTNYFVEIIGFVEIAGKQLAKNSVHVVEHIANDITHPDWKRIFRYNKQNNNIKVLSEKEYNEKINK